MAIKYSSGTKSRLIVTLVVFAMLVASPTTGSTALGFISLDCGSPEGTNYTDETTRINYISDSIFIQSGTIETILPSYQTKSIQQQFSSVRAFPEGTRNCYTLTPAQGKFKQYLIRASFFYGNYDSKDQLPSFDLHLGVNYWGPVTLVDARTPINVEIIYIPQTDYIDVCLVKTGSTTPFISSLELRLLNNTNIMYTSQHGSLHLFYRLYFNYGTTRSIRYDDDSYDRIWQPFSPLPNTTTLSTESTISQNLFQLPSAVMQSACTPLNSSMPIQFYWNARNTSEQYYIYMHFAELAPLQANQHRQFSIYLNNEIFYENVVPRYLAARTIFSTSPQANNSRYRLTLKRTLNSTLPPIINAIEIYTVKEFLMKETYEKDGIFAPYHIYIH